MGNDGGYRAWCGKSPLVWIGPPYRDAGSAGTRGLSGGVISAERSEAGGYQLPAARTVAAVALARFCRARRVSGGMTPSSTSTSHSTGTWNVRRCFV